MQQPTFQKLPAGNLDLSTADDCGFFAAVCGLVPDPWQQHVLDGWLSRRKVGTTTRWAADRCGLAVPRQNGKNGVLEMVELFKMVDMGRRVLHTAHQVRTSRAAFTRLAGFFEDYRNHPDLFAMVDHIRYANGQEEIVLVNGGSVQFTTRSKSTARGFTVDDLVCDEAQELSAEALEALLPTLSAAPSQDPQTIMTGTPPSPLMDGEAFTRFHDDAHKGNSRRLAWLEWAATRKDLDSSGLDDKTLWAKANPALGRRVTMSAIENERALMDDIGFARERLGVWQAGTKIEVIPRDKWLALATSTPAPPGGRHVFGVDMSEDRNTCAVAVAVDRGNGVTHVELALLADTTGGPGDVIKWLTARRNTPVIIDGYSPAAALQADLTANNVRVTLATTRQLADGCGALVDRVNATRLTHYNQDQLNRAVFAGSKRAYGTGGGWVWHRKHGDASVGPLIATTLAVWGLGDTTTDKNLMAPGKGRWGYAKH